MGKGSKRRPEDKKKVDDNWDRIFGKSEDKKSPASCAGQKGERP